MEKVKIETKEAGEKKAEGMAKEEMEGGVEEEEISEEDIAKQEAEIKTQDQDKLVKQREKIKEMPEQKEEKTVKERTIEKLSKEYPNAPEDLLKNYIEATKKLAEMGILTKLKEEKNLMLKEKLALLDWKNIKATINLFKKSK